MKHYNYQSDFKIEEPLKDDAPFRYTYFTKKGGKAVVAEYDGTEYKNCIARDGKLTVPIEHGAVGLGEVKVKREYFLTDSDFADGVCDLVTDNVPTDIEVWHGPTDAPEVVRVGVAPYYTKGDKGDTFTYDDLTQEQKEDLAYQVIGEAENERREAENERRAAELVRQENEVKRERQESERIETFNSNEAQRENRFIASQNQMAKDFQNAETSRNNIFTSNEAIRKENETKRVNAEILRQEAESIREATYKNKVDRDDNAPKLTAGFANNLVGRGEATPQEISFRPSGGDTSIEDGTARIERLKGSTVVWNQRIQWSGINVSAHGLMYSSPKEGVVQISGTYTGRLALINVKLTTTRVPIPIGNKYLILSNSDKLKLRAQGAIVYNGIFVATDGCEFDPVMLLEGMVTGQEVNITFSPTFLDLTQMFGAGNEPTTIEEFHARKPIGMDEYAYNEGELVSTTADELKSVGFNAWDEEWEEGTIGFASGNPAAATNRIRSKNYCRCLPNTRYYNPAKTSVIFYDEDYKYVSYAPCLEFVTPNNAHWFKIATIADYGATYKGDICIHLVHTGYRNGEYEPYKEFRRGIPIKDIKDADGNQLFPNGLLSAGNVHDEITATKAIKRIGVVDMGTLAWLVYSNIPYSKDYFYSSNFGGKKGGAFASSKYLCSKGTLDTNINDKSMISSTSTGIAIVYDTAYTDAATFKAAMQGVMLYYELAEPIEVDLPEPLNLDYEVSDFGTEEVLSSEPTTPMKADIIYQFNAVDRIRDNSRHTAEAEIKLRDYETRIAALEAIVASLTSGEV